MPLDLPPALKFWSPAKPGIVRSGLDLLRLDAPSDMKYGTFPFPFFCPSAQVLFPIVEATNTSVTPDTTDTNTHAVALPANIQAGNLLIIILALWEDNTARTVTTPATWTQLYNIVGTGTIRRFVAYYKVASGSEGASVTVTASSTVGWACNSYRISNYTGVPEAATAGGTSTTPNPPSVTPSWGARNTLWIAVEGDADATTTAVTSPANYTNQLTAVRSPNPIASGTGPRLSSALRELNAASEDPGTWTIPSSDPWNAATIAVRPAILFPVTSLSLFNTALSTAQTITAPASIVAGDLIVLMDRAGANSATAPVAVTPTGFTLINGQVLNDASDADRVVWSYKIAVGTEGGTSITGMNGAFNSKVMAVFRGDVAIGGVTVADVEGAITNVDPADFTVSASGGTPPLIVLATYSIWLEDAATVDPRSMSPAKDSEIGAAAGDVYLAWKIYNASPADVTVGMADEGFFNCLQSCYISVVGT